MMGMMMSLAGMKDRKMVSLAGVKVGEMVWLENIWV